MTKKESLSLSLSSLTSKLTSLKVNTVSEHLPSQQSIPIHVTHVVLFK